MQDTDPAPPASQADSLVAWIRLERTPGVGPAAAAALLAQFGLPEAIFDAGAKALSQYVSKAQAQALCGPAPSDLPAVLDTLGAWLARPSHHLLTLADPRYPPLLRHIPDPPILLYAVGRLELLALPSTAIVGSRNASRQGVADAGAFAQALSSAGLVIVSGLAMGIDAAAHEGALRAGGSTVAVIGTGADRIYPRANEQLARRIAEQGCIVSEYALGTPPQAMNFPKRNRLISGLSGSVLVVEAAAGSGSLITAKLACDQGRDVFAIPGSIHSPLSKGCHQLIKGGAKLVDTAADLLDELKLAPLSCISPASGPATPHEHISLLQLMGHGPVDYDTLATLSAAGPGPLARQLLSLELAGHLERLPGGFFQRVIR